MDTRPIDDSPRAGFYADQNPAPELAQRRAMHRGAGAGTERNVVPYPRDQTITQSATGTQEIWNQVYWWTDWYPITDWEPADLSKVPVNTTVTQTMHFRRDQFMKEVSNLNNIRNDQTYIQSEFRSETRQAQGTQPLPTDATVKVKPKAPEVKVQNSQTKGGAQISVEDKNDITHRYQFSPFPSHS
ncbi:hypothetical protein OH491_27730 (plasmid) [Termitidicoccus mucosus]|uniref:hypothetical protein n=1 Tax=Termitidicoccus mucosus TaxID=1184151 RepID=UPI003183BC95